ncbi:hypothetical protein [Nonomuraea sp. SBT364]|uniref:hypothetical protein n=1 Tax=Nonomuraea sp. SBT364 TaxID=1580530 RepID=UPI00066DFDC5|nr:hypothetical protein [Nonomuraea sp. SBT364]
MEGDHRRRPYGGREGEPDELWDPAARNASSSAARRGLEPADPAGPVWDSLPPSARLYGAPADPGPRVRRRVWRRWGGALLGVLMAVGLVAGLVAVALRVAAPGGEQAQLTDSIAGVLLTLPEGWQEGKVPPVTGFTSVARAPGGAALVMARPVPGEAADPAKAAKEAAERYSDLLLKGDRVTVVADEPLARGHTRALRAEYDDVVNRPAYLRVTLVTENGRTALLVGLLQPEDEAGRQAVDTVLASVRYAATRPYHSWGGLARIPDARHVLSVGPITLGSL